MSKKDHKLIGICGFAGSGKDQVGLSLASLGCRRFAFATALKEIAYAINPFIGEYANDHGKIIVHGYLQYVVDELGWDEAKKHPEVRRFMQRLGTEGMREQVSKDFWIDRLDAARIEYLSVAPNEVHYITDVRFPNEAHYIKQDGGVIWRVVRPGYESKVDKSHASESEASQIGHDYLIINDGSLESLAWKVSDAFKLFC